MNRQRGFTLIEILLAISLLGTFTLIASRLLYADLNLDRHIAETENAAARFDRAVEQMRADVWQSESMQKDGDNGVQIGSGERAIHWRMDRTHMVRRVGLHDTSWDVGQPLQVTIDGGIVILSISASHQIALTPMPKVGER